MVHELPVFEKAATFPMILIAQKGVEFEGDAIFTQAKSLEPPYPDVSLLIKESGVTLAEGSLDGANWLLTDSKTANSLRRIASGKLPLGKYVGNQIHYGIKTGLDAAFVIDESIRMRLLFECPESTQIIKPYIIGDNVRKWTINYQNKYVLYMHHGVDVKNLTPVLEYLRSFKAALERRATQQEWYELQQPSERYVSAYGHPKIVYPEIAKEARFTYDSHGFFPNKTVFTIPIDDLYLLGVLNSQTAWRFLKLICPALGDPETGGRLTLQTVYLSQLPIPTASASDRNTISDLVQKCLDAKGRDCAEWDKEIDARVFSLYGI